jgi:antitoxin ParD1/3/4
LDIFLKDATLVLTIHTGGQAMARTTSITIGAELDVFVGKLIESGRYGSTSEVVRSALRLLERHENQMAALKSAVEAGERSGESNLSLRDIAAQVKQKHLV